MKKTNPSADTSLPFATRRGFLAGLTSCSAFAGCSTLGFGDGAPDLTFGVLSDIHLNKPGDEDTFLAALAYFRDQGADGVVIAGDIADTGANEQLNRCGACWNKIFPGNRAPDGRHVEKLFVYGNHDVDGWSWGASAEQKADPAFRAECITPENRAAVWERAFGEKYEPIWLKTVRGYSFVGAHWPAQNDVPAYLAAHKAELAGKRPFFFIQHAHPYNTCFGPWAWGHDDGTATKALSAFPNAVAFTGHSHYTLTDERSVWQGAFTSINTASLLYASHDYALRENMEGNSGGYTGDRRRRQMSCMNTGDGRQGMLIRAYGARLVIERRDFVAGCALGPDWDITIPGGEEMSFEARAAKRTAPEFDAAAKVRVEQDATHVTVKFPAARTVDGCRPYEYEVTATLVEDGVDLVQCQRRMMALGFYKSEADARKIREDAAFRFLKNELPHKGHFVFSVRPLECFGKKGAAIASSVVVVK